MEKQLETQILIVGGGVTGTAIARELSRYKVDTILVEKGVDVCAGESRSSHGFIYSSVGLAWASSLVLKSIVTEPGVALVHPESLKEQLTRKGFEMWKAYAKELDVRSYTPMARIAVAFNDDDLKALAISEKLCLDTGFEPQKLDREALLAMEPNLNPTVIAGLADSENYASAYPFEEVIALAENARENGVRVMLGAEVRAIRSLDGGFIVDTARGQIKTKFIINAAGAYADKVAQMAGVCDFGLSYQKSQMLVLDKRLKGLVKGFVAVATRPGIVNGIRQNYSGNLHVVAANYIPTKDPEDVATKREYTRTAISRVQELYPTISLQDVIASFVGVRVFNTRDPEAHIIEASKGNPKFINAAVRLPGTVIAPAVAEYVIGILADQGLALVEKADFNPIRKAIPDTDELPDEERQKLITQDPRYGHIVCRCEEVSEGEIVEAIRRGARTVQGIKYRTRAGMGRCQRGFCGPRVLEILSRELDIPLTEVNQNIGDVPSRVLLYRSKELLG